MLWFLFLFGVGASFHSSLQRVYGNKGMMWNHMWGMYMWDMNEMMTNDDKTWNTSTNETLNNQVLTDDVSVVNEKNTSIVNLKSGDTYDITIKKIRKVINGKSLIMLSYNGSIPGPTIRVAKGSEVTFRVHNSVAWLETTIHPHGLRLDNQYDGVPRVQWWFQDPIKEGGIYEQKLKFPDTGIFWYHPHTRDDFEQELGEYGTFLVYDPKEKLTYNNESIVVLDDILLKNWKVEDFSKDATSYALMGRYGNTFFVNGKTNFSLSMKQGEVKRLYFLNSANARPFRVSIPWMKMKLVWGDNGYYEKETFIESFIIAPAERYMVDVYAEKTWVYNINHIGSVALKPAILGTIKVSKNPKRKDTSKNNFLTLNTHSILGNISNIDSYFTKKADKSLILQMSMKGMEWMGNMGGMMEMMNDTDPIEWEDTMAMMNARSTDKNIAWEVVDDATKKKNMDIDWKFKKGSLVKIHIYNDSNSMHAMQHPFHMHGQRFLVLGTNGKKNSNFVRKDTVLIPKWEYVDILVDMSNPWTWMAHCHIVEHIFAWMMFSYTVGE